MPAPPSLWYHLRRGSRPGDAIGAALSFGDFTVPATGTTTYVCGGKAVAFGHPFLFTGPTVIGATRARVLRIVAYPTFGPIKRGAP